jgi:hypothetical protein
VFITRGEMSRCTQLLSRYLPTLLPDSVIISIGIGKKGYVLMVSCELLDEQGNRLKFSASVSWKTSSQESSLERYWIIHLETAIREEVKRLGYLLPIPNPDETDDLNVELVVKVLDIGKAAL